MLFYAWEDAKSGLTEVIPLMCTLAIWGPFPELFILSLLGVAHGRVADF